jgi:DNA-binding response OmpR family regulator
MEEISTAGPILVVEDDPSTIILVKEVLEKEGFNIISTMDGMEAISHATQYQPILVVLDVWLPKMDGFEICRLLRQQSQVPILMLTGRRREDDKLQGLSCGADDYLIKPFSPKELVARVKLLLRRTAFTPQGPKDSIQDPLRKLRG